MQNCRSLLHPGYSEYMTARDVGGIAGRIFALYLGFYAFQELGLVLEMNYRASFGQLADSPTSVMILKIILVVFAGIVVWVKSSNLWPSDSPVDGSVMTAPQWIKIFVLLLGIYLLTTSFAFPLMAIMKAALQARINWPDISADRLFIDTVRCFTGIGLIAYGASGWKRAESYEL